MAANILEFEGDRSVPAWARTLLALAGTLLVMAALVAVLGANPVEVARTLVTGSVGNTFNLSQTIVVVGILICVALAAAIPFSARLWNIGGEGADVITQVSTRTALNRAELDTPPPGIQQLLDTFLDRLPASFCRTIGPQKQCVRCVQGDERR